MITGLFDRVLIRFAGSATVLSLLALTLGELTPVSTQASTGRIEGQVRLLLPPANAVPSGVYPSRRVNRPAPKASEIANVVVFLKDVARVDDLTTTTATITQKD